MKETNQPMSVTNKVMIVALTCVICYVAIAIWMNARLCDPKHTAAEYASLVVGRYTSTKIGRVAITSSQPDLTGIVTSWRVFGTEGQEIADVTMRTFLWFGLQELKFESREGPGAGVAQEAARPKK